jgi:ADP-ribosyl-[dinitrogen reductase] hydrolase
MNEALKSHRTDRAIGAVIGSAVGDALGSQYEFGPAQPDAFEPTFGHSVFGHGVGEWTDDTQMAMPILDELARGASLNDTTTLGRILAVWERWAHDAKDVGNQTRAVLGALGDDPTEAAGRAAAQAVHESSGRSGGNGSLMRTGPVALGYLAEGREADLADAAGRIAQLTHWEQDNVDAVGLWCLAIRHAVRTGTFDLRAGLGFVPDGARRDRWSGLIDRATAAGVHPRNFRENNGRVVVAFLGAAAAITGATDYRSAITRAIQGGGDTDTVAAITGALAGALYGVSGIPLSWQRKVHGWPGYDIDDLSRLAFLSTRGGEPTSDGYPTAPTVPSADFYHTAPVQHPADPGVWLGSQNALGELRDSVTAVVSLCRVGTAEVPQGLESIRVRLIDQPGHNLNLDFTLADATDIIAELRTEGKQVFVHCAEARSRTAAVGALYAMRHRGIPVGQAWAQTKEVLPYFAPSAENRDAVNRIASAG